MSKGKRWRMRTCKQCHVKLPGRKEIELVGGPAWLATAKYCEHCSRKRGQAQRASTGAKLLAKATITGTQQRDGQTYTVVTLPAKKPHR